MYAGPILSCSVPVVATLPIPTVRKHSLDLLIGLLHRPRDGSVVSSLHCMNDPQPEGHMAGHIERRKFLATLGGAAVGLNLADLPLRFVLRAPFAEALDEQGDVATSHQEGGSPPSRRGSSKLGLEVTAKMASP